MVLEKINSYTKVDQMHGLVGQVIKLVGEHEIEGDANFDTIISEISEKYDFMKSIRESFKPKSSQEIKDSFRDAKYRAFYKIIETALINPEPGVAEAAAPLFEILKPYGLGVVRKTFMEESANLNTIIGILNTPEYRAKMAVIQGGELSFTQLVSAQSHFEQADRTWKTDKSETRGKDSATDVRDVLYSVMNDRLITYLELMMVINPSMYTGLANGVNEFVISNNTVVESRRKESEEEEV